jgi:hypothetical protein
MSFVISPIRAACPVLLILLVPQIIKLFIMQVSPVACCFRPFPALVSQAQTGSGAHPASDPCE